MKRKLIFLALAALGLASCNGGFKKGDGGMLYDIISDKSGPSLKPGDFVVLNFTQKTDADSVLGGTYDMGRPAMLPMQPSKIKGDIFSALMLLSEGDSAVIKLNIDTLSKGHPRQAGVKGKYQVFDIKIEKVISKGNLNDQVFRGRVDEYIKSLNEGFKKQEPITIQNYISDNKLNVTKTDSGLYYIITKPGSGPKPNPGDTVEVNYTVKLLSGKVLETSIKSEAIKDKLQINPMNPYKPIRFAVGVKAMIPGWDEGMQLLNKGSKATLILPSKLAYGQQGSGQLGAYTPLAFDVELVNIIPQNPNAPKPVAAGPMIKLPPPVVKK